MYKLSEKAMLVQLSVSQWAARKLDKQETDALNRQHGSTADAARVNKSLLPTDIHLDLVHKKTGFIRNEFLFHTSPWLAKARVLKATAYLDFTQKFKVDIDEWWGLVENFLTNYPQAVRDARGALNGMFKADDYPSEREMRRKFDIDMAFMPLPDADDWRVSLADDELEYLRASVTRQTQEALVGATNDAWKKVHDVVSAARERLSHPDNTFRDTLVENARELCKVLPMLNITDDPQLENVRRELEGSLCAVEPQVLRDDVSIRLSVSDKMADIMAKMSGMYGAGQQAA